MASLLVLIAGCDKDSDSGTDPDPEPAGITFTYCTTSFQTVIDNNDFEGDLCMDNYDDPDRDINIGNITVRYHLYTFFGEAVHTYRLSWEQGNDAEFDIYTISFRARVKLQNTVQTDAESAYKTFGVGYILDPGAGFGSDVPGSPSWSALFRDASGTYISADASKAIFTEGFELVELEIVKLNE